MMMMENTIIIYHYYYYYERQKDRPALGGRMLLDGNVVEYKAEYSRV